MGFENQNEELFFTVPEYARPPIAGHRKQSEVAQYKLLVLTDHSTHTSENSIYALLREMVKNSRCHQIDVVSRGNDINRIFFEKMAVKSLYASRIHANFNFTEDGRFFKKDLQKVGIRSYDAVLLRLPYPVAPGFWQFLSNEYPNTVFINSPLGIETTGSKDYLLNFPEWCPPMQRCQSLEDIEAFRRKFPVVLKPVRSYGGQGIVKIEGEKVAKAEGGEMNWETFVRSLEGKAFDYLGAKFLPNVRHGDKRIVVCNGKILGAALRLPAAGGWICNIARGGKSGPAEVDEAERAIIDHLNPALTAQGIVFYGIDTLLGDEGRRLLSEINTVSIGGLPKIAEYSGQPVARQAADLLWEFIVSKTEEHQ